MNLSRKKGPLYLQIKNILKDRILHGIYTMASNIPAEPQLEEEFHVSKITVRKAIQELVQEGYLETRSGKGTKVIRNTSTSKLSRGKRFTEFLVEEGHKITKEFIQAQVVRHPEGSELYQLFGGHCLCIERLYYLDDIPYIHFSHYLTEQMENIDQSDFNFQSLYELIEEENISLETFRDQFAVSHAPSHVEDRLNVKKSMPLLKRLRYSYNEAGDLIEYSEGFYNTDMQHYVVNYNI